ncbi:hypothetical protein K3495_g3112 [Podosphaera aphanis]|nr:hypothetical protein K3495_g3112 [Podosphaera aphanis]
MFQRIGTRLVIIVENLAPGLRPSNFSRDKIRQGVKRFVNRYTKSDRAPPLNSNKFSRSRLGNRSERAHVVTSDNNFGISDAQNSEEVFGDLESDEKFEAVLAELMEEITDEYGGPSVHFVEVNVGDNNNPQTFQSLREGFDGSHYLHQAELSSKALVTIFFDYRCVPCYVSESAARFLNTYQSKCPTTHRGISGSGPKVTKEVIVRARFVTTIGYSKFFDVSCGVVANDTFPGDLTLGKSIFDKFGIHCQFDITTPNKEYICQQNFPGQPILCPISYSRKAHLVFPSMTAFLVETPTLPHRKNIWHKDTPLHDKLITN